jgi:hypothetical protein
MRGVRRPDCRRFKGRPAAALESVMPLVGMMFMFLMMKALAVILERIDLLSATVGGQPSRKTDRTGHR